MNDYVSVDLERPAQELADILTQAGIPVEEVQTLDKGLKKVYTGKIIEIGKHPDADKLQVCQVECIEDGAPVVKQIVTAATNVAVGQVVPVAYHKSRLADGTEIKKGKLRGEVSEGMFCSVAELGVPSDLVMPGMAEGIYIFPEGTPIGADVKDVLGLNDVVYEFELTPNRADCFSMVGLSREFGVLTNKEVRFPEVKVTEEAELAASELAIHIEANDVCSLFMGRVLKDIVVAPSPQWMQNRLRSAGIRPINNIVDVTNYVMIELGQPMHAYDLSRIDGQRLTARMARDGEILRTLDGVDRNLTASMLVIASDSEAVGIAGVMGGESSEVTGATKDIVLEAAVFNGASIRRTSKAVGLRSEASGRFERTVNGAFTELAINRAAQLLKDICPTAKVLSGIVVAGEVPSEERTVVCTVDQVNAYLGTTIEDSRIVDILKKLYFTVEDISEGTDTKLVLGVPSWRSDVIGMPDIAEEVGRIYGYDNIPVTTPIANLKSGELTNKQKLIRFAKHYLVGAGLSEIITFSFMHKNSLDKLKLASTDERYNAVAILNPISEEFPYMRTTLVPSVIDTVVKNQKQTNHDIQVFEVGAVYLPTGDTLPTEKSYITGMLVGKAYDVQWNMPNRDVDFYDAKGIVGGLLHALRLPNIRVERANVAYLHPGVGATIYSDEIPVAHVGQLHPEVAKSYDVNGKGFIFEIDLEAILEIVPEALVYEPISKFPGTSRDLAIVAPTSVTADEIMQIIETYGGNYLVRAYVFDVYEGVHIQKGYRSLAYSLEFRSNEGTLTDADIEGNINAIIEALGEKDCKLR